MQNKSKDSLIYEWKIIRANFFNRLGEDEEKFEKLYRNHPFYSSVKKHFNKSFKEVNQLAQKEIEIFIKNVDTKGRK